MQVIHCASSFLGNNDHNIKNSYMIYNSNLHTLAVGLGQHSYSSTLFCVFLNESKVKSIAGPACSEIFSARTAEKQTAR